MFRRRKGLTLLLAAAALGWVCSPHAGRTDPPSPAGAGPATPAEPAAEKVRRALDQVVDLQFADHSLAEVADQLQSRTGVRFFVDPKALPALRQKIEGTPPLVGLPGGPPPPEEETKAKSTKLTPGLRCDLRRVRLRTGLAVLLGHYGLGYAVLGDTVVISSAAEALHRQHGQLVDVDLKEVPLARALQDLGRRTATEVVLDRRGAKQGETRISVRLQDVPLERAVRLMAEMAGLDAVAQGKVVFVTTTEVARGLRAEAAAKPVESTRQKPAEAPSGLGFDPSGGGRLNPLGGFGGVGGLGGGLGGIGGLGGLGGLGGGGLGGPLPQAQPVDPGPAPRVGEAGSEEKPAKKAEAPGQPAAKDGGKKPAPGASAQALQKLAEPMEVKGESLTTPHSLAEVLRFLNEGHGFPPLLFDEAAFRADYPDAPDLKETQVKLPRMKSLPRERVLRLLLAQLPVGATFLVRSGNVEITTGEGASPERQAVRAAFVKRPLEEALEDLSDQTGISIVLDARAGDRGRTPVTASFRSEVSLLNAVRLLADMADLKAVIVDNVIYVTPRSNSAEFPPAGVPGVRKREAGGMM